MLAEAKSMEAWRSGALAHLLRTRLIEDFLHLLDGLPNASLFGEVMQSPEIYDLAKNI